MASIRILKINYKTNIRGLKKYIRIFFIKL